LVRVSKGLRGSCLLVLAECRRLVRVSKRLRCIIVSTERDIALSSDVVQDNTGKGYVACFLWFCSQVVKACKVPLKNSICNCKSSTAHLALQ